MAETITIKAEARDRAGKGAARAARRAGLIPSVIYGDGQPPLLLAINAQSIRKLLLDPAFLTHIYDVEIDGGTHHCIARDLALDPVSDKPIHIDFQRVSDRSTIHATIPVQFVNADAAPGIKIGGVLNVVRHEVEIICRADRLPDHLTVDLTGAEIGTSLRVSTIKLPEGARPAVGGRDFVIATISPPTVSRAEAEATAATPAAAS